MNSFIEKYKPHNLQSIVIDSKIKDLIQLFLELNNLNILFIGDSGSGKSLFIQCILNEYIQIYSDSNESKHIDIDSFKKDNMILYIQSLRDQNIHTFRDSLKTFCKTTNYNKNNMKKIIIIDDIDDLNESNQQVIRHCMNKYLNKVHFLCSCTNIQKVMDNIQSRTNIINIPKLNTEQISSIIQNICIKENIQMDAKLIKILIKISSNSIRNILNNLEKMSLYTKNITVTEIKNICSSINLDIFDKYTNNWYNKKHFEKSYSILLELYNLGYSVIDIIENYYYYIKLSNMMDEDKKLEIIPIITKYINIFYTIHEDEFELIFFTKELIEKIK
jgi:DNA polymerase III delta prime subunit